MFFNLFRSAAGTVRTINKKYGKPHIKMTPAVKFSLGLLRFYLLFLVGILVYKFVVTLHQ
jgi:hypothetical protein